MTISPQTPAAPVKPKADGLATWSLILGIAGLLTCGLTAVVGLVLGIIALARKRGQEGTRRARNLAIAGVLISVIMIPVTLPMTGLLIIFRNEIRAWVGGVWSEAKNESQSDQDPWFGGQPKP